MAPGSTAVWLPGLGDRWPQHSRLCLPSIHAHLSSVSWGAGGWGLPLHPPLSPGSPFLVPAPSSPPLTPFGAPSPPRCSHPQTAPLSSAYPAFHVPALPVLTPLKGLFTRAAFSASPAVPAVGVPTQCWRAADVTACHVQSPKAGRENSLLSVAARLPQPLLNPRAIPEPEQDECVRPHP